MNEPTQPAGQPGRLNIFLAAAEESGDRLGAALMRALKARSNATFTGVGGHEMAREGVASVVPIDDLANIGFTALPLRLPAIWRHIRATGDAAIAARPDALVIIDSPDFTHRVARRV